MMGIEIQANCLGAIPRVWHLKKGGVSLNCQENDHKWSRNSGCSRSILVSDSFRGGYWKLPDGSFDERVSMPFRFSLAGGQRAEEEAVNGTRVEGRYGCDGLLFCFLHHLSIFKLCCWNMFTFPSWFGMMNSRLSDYPVFFARKGARPQATF